MEFQLSTDKIEPYLFKINVSKLPYDNESDYRFLELMSNQISQLTNNLPPLHFSDPPSPSWLIFFADDGQPFRDHENGIYWHSELDETQSMELWETLAQLSLEKMKTDRCCKIYLRVISNGLYSNLMNRSRFVKFLSARAA